MTQIAMIPVAWTKGTEFKRAPRYPAREITYVDGFARTWEHGPSDPARHADGPGTVVEVDIKASAALVWPYVSDITFGADASDEFTGARWADGYDQPALGAQFIGSNTHNAIGQWEVPCFVDRYEEGRDFGWVTSEAMPDKEPRILARRIDEHRANMQRVVDAIKAAAEADAANARAGGAERSGSRPRQSST